MHTPRWVAGIGSIVVAALINAIPTSASAATTPPDSDPFYRYTDATPLADIAPGTVLKTRTLTATLPDIPTPVTMIQLLYRTRDQLGKPVATVTSVLRPPTPAPTTRLLSYQSFYDALTTRCEPSYTLNGGPTNGTWSNEQHFVAAFLLQGFTVVTSDFESQNPAFATGPIYGYETLDGIRAAYGSSTVGLPTGTKVAMAGYSGGAIATEWATELAPQYAPDVNSKLLGSAFGGVFVDPVHNLHYVDGSDSWASVMPLAFIGISRAFALDFDPYLSDYGKQLVTQLKDDCIGEHSFPGLTFASLVRPQYAKPESIPLLVNTANKLIMSTGGQPTVPMMIRQGTDGATDEGTQPSPTYGPGDGVMVAADVRTLARKYCGYGLPVDYAEKPLGHTKQGASFMVESIPWLQSLFLGLPATSTCGTIAEGNSIDPVPPGNTEGVRYYPHGNSAFTCDGKPANFVGTNGADTITGTSHGEVILALGGNDKIVGAESSDTICAGSGDDRVDGGSGYDRLLGQAGNDSVIGGSGNDYLRGDAGIDVFSGGSGNDYLQAKDGTADKYLDGGTGRNSAQIDRGDPKPRNATYKY